MQNVCISSNASREVTAFRNRLFRDIYEALQNLKSGYPNGRTRALDQAEAHSMLYLEEFTNFELDDDRASPQVSPT